MKKVVVVYSGGMDSTVLLYYLLSQGYELKAMSVLYGQRHLKELQAAQHICSDLGVEHRVADLHELGGFLHGSTLLATSAKDVPEGHYADESMKATVVPNRNMLLLSTAIAWAISSHYDAVAYGAHAGDHTIYPDCRPEFVDAIRGVARLCDWHQVDVWVPFLEMTKADICSMGDQLGVPFWKTWSCYKGQEVHCGKCGTCVERVEAFRLAGVVDPTEYSSL